MRRQHAPVRRSLICAAFTLAISFGTSLPAGAAVKNAKFCRTAVGVSIIPSPSVPSSDSLISIAAAMSKLPGDIASLKALHTKFIEAASNSPSANLSEMYRAAGAEVVKESTALANIIAVERAVVAHPTSSRDILALARDLVAATSAAAAANADLTLDHPLVLSACKVG